MPPSTPAPAVVRPRPAAVVNAEIRALAGRSALTAGERELLAVLWAEWRAAVEAERGAA